MLNCNEFFNHALCYVCYNELLKKSDKCPVCRADIKNLPWLTLIKKNPNYEDIKLGIFLSILFSFVIIVFFLIDYKIL
jgi:hypothetical protein